MNICTVVSACATQRDENVRTTNLHHIEDPPTGLWRVKKKQYNKNKNREGNNNALLLKKDKNRKIKSKYYKETITLMYTDLSESGKRQ